MASSNRTRWRLACDHCETAVWVGPTPAGRDVWCEACQVVQSLASDAADGTPCARCGVPLPGSPRFLEVWGGLQHLDAVLAAWAGDARALATLLPERPRFLTDLDPPASRPGDTPALAERLAACARGDYRAVRAAAPCDELRAHAAHAIACERMHDLDAAVASWDAAIACEDDARSRLARGALHARAGRWDAAEADLARAGDSFEARWDRAALALHRTIVERDAMPDDRAWADASRAVGPASDYWSDPTLGRLTWSLVVERTLVTHREGAPLEPAAHARLVAAAARFEHATFWDLAMQVVGWARVGAFEEVARLAQALAGTQASATLAEPAVRGPALRAVAEAVASARTAMAAGDPEGARRAIAPAVARRDLQHFRIPCLHCGMGSVGVDEMDDPDEAF